MKRAKEILGNRGFCNFRDTSKSKCYDYTCEKDGILYDVEVKWTQGLGSSVFLTRNEFEHWQQHKQTSIAVVVHDVKLEVHGNSVLANAGEPRVCDPWDIPGESLEPVQYKWSLPESPGA